MEAQVSFRFHDPDTLSPNSPLQGNSECKVYTLQMMVPGAHFGVCMRVCVWWGCLLVVPCGVSTHGGNGMGTEKDLGLIFTMPESHPYSRTAGERLL